MPLTLPKLLRVPLWVSEDGKFAVVEGPFPAGMIRTLDTSDPERAQRKRQMLCRGATTHAGRYAKVRFRDLAPTENEYGEVHP